MAQIPIHMIQFSAGTGPVVPIPAQERHGCTLFPGRRALYLLGVHSPTITEDLLAPINDFPSFRINTGHWISRYFADTEFSKTINTACDANTGVSPSCAKTEDQGQGRPFLPFAGLKRFLH